MTRMPEKAQGLKDLGVEVVQGDLREPASLARACQGMDKVLDAAHGFNPGDKTNTVKTIDEAGKRSLIEAAKTAGVEHYIFISILGAAPDSPMELFHAKYAEEQHLKASGLCYTILRAAAFIEFWTNMVGEPVLKTGKTTVFGRGDNPVNFVSADDVARFSLLALEDPQAQNQTIDMGEPENLSFNQAVAIFEKVAGKKAAISHIPLPVMRVMRVVMQVATPIFSKQITGRILIDTTDQNPDMTPVLAKYQVELTHLEVIARRMVVKA
jgi:uncharacterized protein YbjT (DUF2867 family)